MQNTPTGCGNNSPTRQAPFWEKKQLNFCLAVQTLPGDDICLSCRSGEPLIVKSSVPEVLSFVVLGFLAELEDVSSCSTRRHVFLLNKKTCLLLGQEDMSC